MNFFVNNKANRTGSQQTKYIVTAIIVLSSLGILEKRACKVIDWLRTWTRLLL